MQNTSEAINRKNRRASGVLLPVFSLPGRYGCGSFGREALSFVDFLAESGFSYWQVLPFGMTDEYHSPYASYGSFSGNPYFIDVSLLCEAGLLTEEERKCAEIPSPYAADYERLAHERIPLLLKAASRETDRAPIRKFMEENPHVAEFCRYMALRDKHTGIPSRCFPDDLPDGERLFGWEFIEYTFYTQWARVRAYANERGISIIGDLPIYVSLESADVYCDPRQFQLTRDGDPRMVAGVPPDDFTEDGQLWGNPLYNWQEMKKDNYRWWRDRLAHMLMLFDGVRIDHFRGLEAYYAIPAGAKNARNGKWQTGPGRPFIRAMKEIAGDALLIAEDLGNITPAVESLVRYSGFYATRVFQFAFGGDDDRHLPHAYGSDVAAYTGTHDNNTLYGYLMESDDATRESIRRYVGGVDARAETLARDARRVLLSSHANLVICPVQDLLVYGADTRINTPGRASGNWRYRVTAEQLASLDRRMLYEENRRYGRI